MESMGDKQATLIQTQYFLCRVGEREKARKDLLILSIFFHLLREIVAL